MNADERPVPASRTVKLTRIEDAAFDALNGAKPMIGTRHRIGDLSDAELPDVEHIIDPLLPRGHVILFSSHGGGGKSKIGLTWASYIACGINWNNLPTQRGRTLFVSLEDPVEVVKYRLQQIIRRFRLRASDIDDNIEILSYSEEIKAALAVERSMNGERYLHMTAIFDEIGAVALSGNFDLVIIDNASDGFHAGENARADVSQFVRSLAIAIGRGGDRHIAVLLLAHIDKGAARSGDGGGNDYSGSTAWHNSVRCRIALIRKGEGEGFTLEHQKSNFRALLPPIHMAWIGSLPELSSPGAVSAAGEQQVQTDADTVLNAVRAAIRSGREIPVASSGGYTCYRLLQSFPELGDELRNHKDGSKRVNAAMVKLQSDGKLCIEKFRRDYKDRQRWALAENTPNEVRS